MGYATIPILAHLPTLRGSCATGAFYTVLYNARFDQCRRPKVQIQYKTNHKPRVNCVIRIAHNHINSMTFHRLRDTGLMRRFLFDTSI